MSREKQIEEMAEILCADYHYGSCLVDGFPCGEGSCKKRERIEALINAGYRKVEQGEWKPVMQELNYCDTLECSVCEFVIDISQGDDYRYCPNCGAKMKGE